MKNVLSAAVAALVLMAGGASAATLTATYNGDFPGDTTGYGAGNGLNGQVAFVIEFDDSIGTQNGIFEFDRTGVNLANELTSFTWSNNPFYGGSQTMADPGTRTRLWVAADVTGFSEGVGLPNNFWIFVNQTSATQSLVDRSRFSYSLSAGPTTSAVPLPAGAVLLVSALAGIGLMRQRRHKEA